MEIPGEKEFLQTIQQSVDKVTTAVASLESLVKLIINDKRVIITIENKDANNTEVKTT